MFVIMSTAAFAFFVVVVVMFVIMSTAAFAFFVMVVMFVIVATAAFAFFVMVMMMFSAFRANIFRCLLSQQCQFCFQRIAMFHCFQNLHAFQLIPGSSNDRSILIMLAQQSDTLGDLVLTHAIGTAENDAVCIFYLIIEKFAEILHIHFAFFCIYYRCKAIQLNICIIDILHCQNYIAQFTYTGGLYQNTVRCIFIQYLLHCGTEVTYQTAADTSGGHFVDLNPGLLHEHAVDTDLAEFILDQHQLFATINFVDQFFDQRGLAGTQKSRKNINLRHILHTFC